MYFCKEWEPIVTNFEKFEKHFWKSFIYVTVFLKMNKQAWECFGDKGWGEYLDLKGEKMRMRRKWRNEGIYEYNPYTLRNIIRVIKINVIEIRLENVD
jgi:hypothetical protein